MKCFRCEKRKAAGYHYLCDECYAQDDGEPKNPGREIIRLERELKEARGILETVCFHLRRNDHIEPPTGSTCTNQMISRIERFLSENIEGQTAETE